MCALQVVVQVLCCLHVEAKCDFLLQSHLTSAREEIFRKIESAPRFVNLHIAFILTTAVYNKVTHLHYFLILANTWIKACQVLANLVTVSQKL